MKPPQSYETAWQDAERRVFEFLAEQTQTAEGRGAFLGDNPGVLNAWHLESGAPGDLYGGDTLIALDKQSLGIPYRAACTFTSRAECQKWVMRVIRAVAMFRDADSNVILFQISGMGAVKPGAAHAANEQAPVKTWSVEITFDLVFLTRLKEEGVM